MKGTSPKKRDSRKAGLFVSRTSVPTPIDDSTIAAAKSIRILVADRHPLFRFGARELLRRQRDCLVVGEAETAEQTVALAQTVSAAIVLLDSALSGSAIVLTRLHTTDVRTIVVAGPMLPSEITMVIRLGARGVIAKDAAPELFVKCVRAVAAGELWLPRRDLAQIVNALSESAAPTMTPARLTQREREVIELVATGESNRNIARLLLITEDTVKHHLTNVFDKTGVSNRLELTLFAQKHDLVNIA
jgi:DNA-binding NarL/FixJ family response regulator